MIRKFKEIKLTNELCLKTSQAYPFRCIQKHYKAKNQCVFMNPELSFFTLYKVNYVETFNIGNGLKHCFSEHLLLKIMMKTIIFLFCTTLFSLTPKHALSQNNKIIIDRDREVTVDEVFNIVKKQTDYMFVYHRDLFKNFPKIKLKRGATRLNELLDISVSSSDISVIFTANNIILIKEKTSNVRQKQLQVSGIITDESGFPLPGVTVLIKGTNKGVSSNLDGKYVITVSDPANVLVFSSLGFETQEKMVGNQVIINVSLKDAISLLQEVTINAGYYNTSERERTGSISKIDAKIIEKQPVNNPLAAMQGHLPGVHIVQKTGVSGGGYRIRIRGSNFLGINNGFIDPNTEQNDPLYIIDGVPYDTNTLAIGDIANNILGGARVSPLNTINPADIKSIEVLKDADATAIYGSRGANGVVLITTKKGRVGKTEIKVNVSNTISEVTRFANLMNTEQYLEMRIEALENDGYTLETVPPWFKDRAHDLYIWDQNRYTDWQKVLIGNTAFRQSAQLSFSGGSENTQFLLSGSYSSTGNVFPGDFKYKNSSVHFNINHQSKDNHFKLNVSGTYGADDNNLPSNDLTVLASTLAPNAPTIYDTNGDLNWENSTWKNPLARLESKYNSKTYSLIANTSLSYHPIESLGIKANLGYTKNNLEAYVTNPKASKDPNTNEGQDSSFSSISKNNGSSLSWIVEPQINWVYHWKGISLDMLLGATFQQSERQQLQLGARNFPSDALLHTLTAAETRTIVQDTESEYKYHAVFGRINFNWKKYILNLTGRRDGSSRFGPGKQFGYFGAVGMAWLFSKEDFFQNNTFLSFGKLRGSYGITGSDSSPDYSFYDSYSVSQEVYNGSGLRPTRLFNPNLAWESNKKLEVGLELGLFNDRVFVTSSWYRNRSSNQLIDVPLPRTTGFSSINSNFNAIIENSGIEIDLRTINIQKNNIKWRTTFNISANRNKLVAFPNLENTTFNNSLVVGEPINIKQYYNVLGVDPDTGLWQYKDYNNDGVINGNDNLWLADFTPKYTGGLGNTINYKNLQLDIFFQFTKQKGRAYFQSGILNLGSLVQNMQANILDRWQQSGDQNPIQRYYVLNPDATAAANRYQQSSAAIRDASFIRLRNVSLSYRISKEATNGLGVNIYLQGQNLFLITRYVGADPEIPGSRTLPPLRQFTLGMNLTF